MFGKTIIVIALRTDILSPLYVLKAARKRLFLLWPEADIENPIYHVLDIKKPQHRGVYY